MIDTFFLDISNLAPCWLLVAIVLKLQLIDVSQKRQLLWNCLILCIFTILKVIQNLGYANINFHEWPTLENFASITKTPITTTPITKSLLNSARVRDGPGSRTSYGSTRVSRASARWSCESARGSRRSALVLNVVTNCYKLIQNVKCCYKILQSITKVSNVVTKCYKSVKCCYKILQKITKMSNIVTKCYKLLQIVTKCYKVLQRSKMLLPSVTNCYKGGRSS